ncbi:MAG TPA: cell wall-binding repeat-containing protein [Coriobacteriia bacterium]|nr:cell wall-binding repeat-containing protein [Coriobacteriia bacterium]
MLWKRIRTVIAVALVVAAFMALVPSAADAAPPYFVRTWGTNGTGNGQFRGAHNVTVDGGGNVYACDLDNNRIQKFDSAGNFVLSFGGSGSASGLLNNPRGVSCDSAGNVYVADMGNNRIQKFTSAGAFVMAFGTSGTTSARLSQPHSIAFDSAGNIYVSDMGKSRVAKFNSAGVYQSQFGTSGSGSLSSPRDIAADGSGNFWVCDTGHNRIVEFNSSGTYVRAFGSAGAATGQFMEAHGIAVSTDGNVYVSDADNNNVQVFSDTGTFMYRWGTSGSSHGQFDSPTGLASDSDGFIYVGDEQNDRIQVFGMDRTAPVTTSDAPIVWKNAPFDVALTPTDTQSGVETTKYRIDGGSWQTYSGSISVTIDGQYLLEFYSVDKSGNIEDVRSAYLKLDTVDPDVSLLGFTDQEHYNTDIEPDAESGDPTAVIAMTLDGEEFTPGGTATGEGTYQVVATATDPAGNTAEASGEFTIDKTAPTGTMQLDGGAAFTRDEGVSLDSDVNGADEMCFDVVDGSGPTSPDGYVDERDVTLPTGDGEKTVVAHYSDSAGNELELTDTIILDTTPPEITVEDVSDETTYNREVTPDITTDDDDATLEITLDGELYTPGTPITEEGWHTIVIVATDAAGNTNTTTIRFEIDYTAPVITVTGVVDERLYANPVTPNATCDDPGAVLSATLNGEPYVLGTQVLTDGVYRLVVTAIDDHGNSAMATIDFIIDRTAPAVSISGVAEGGAYSAAVYPTGTSPDPGATIVMTLDGAPFTSGSKVGSEGSHVVVATATDKAGNSATATAHFSISIIEVQSVGNRSPQSAAASYSAWGFTGAKTVIIARDDDSADALIGTSLARVYGAPLLLTGKSSLSASTRAEIERLGAKNAIVLGGKLAIKQKVASTLKGMGVDVVRIGGKSRYETSALVAKRIKKLEGTHFSKKVIIVNGANYADALAVVPLANELDAPILMTRTGSASRSVKSFMGSVKWRNVVVVGPKSSVSSKLAKKLASRTKGTYTRLGGSTRYKTAAAVNTYLTRVDPSRSAVIGVVWGRDWPASIAGGVAIAEGGGLVVPVASTTLTQPTSAYLATRAGTVDTIVRVHDGHKPTDSVVALVRQTVTR